MRIYGYSAALLLSLLAAVTPASHAQGVINTAAGGGPNNIPALSAGFDAGQMAEDKAGNLYVVSFFQDRVFKITPAGLLTVFAGNGVARGQPFSGEGGPATTATLNQPEGVAVDSSGNVFIGDTDSNLGFIGFVREVSGTTGQITTVAQVPQGPASLAVDRSGNLFIAANNVIYELVAGAGNLKTFAGGQGQGFSGDGGPATNAQLFGPTGLFADPSGNIFFADSGNNRIREVQASTGVILTVAGNGTPGFGGDGGAATNAELNSPSGVFVDGAGNIFITDSSNMRVREVMASTGFIRTIAGTGTQGFAGDGGPATSAELSGPGSIWVDRSGNVLFADTGNFRIREFTVGGNIQTFAGNGTPSLDGDGFAAVDVSLNFPRGVATDTAGNIFIADSANNVVREIVATTGKIQTVAGNGVAGNTGDGGVATNAELNSPVGVAVDSLGNIFIADAGNDALREVAASSGQIQTLRAIRGDCMAPNNCGNEWVAVRGPGDVVTAFTGGVWVDHQGNIFTVDAPHCMVTELVAATQKTVTIVGGGCGFGGDGGPAVSALLFGPAGITGDKDGNLFIADSENFCVREVLASSDIIVTVAGNCLGAGGFSGDGGPATQAAMRLPLGIAIDPGGNLWISDSNNGRVRKVSGSVGAPVAVVAPGSVTFTPAVFIGSTGTPQSVTLTNSGSASLSISSIAIAGGNSGDFTESNTCAATLSPGNSCTISVNFAPAATGSRVSSLTVTDNAVGSPHSVLLTGVGAAASLSVGVASGGSTSAVVTAGQTASYSLQISAAGGAGSISASVSCTGAPAGASCNVPAMLNLIAPGATPLMVTVSTSAHSALVHRERRPEAPIGVRMVFFSTSVVLLALMWLLKRRQLLYPCGQARTVSMSVSSSSFALLLLAVVFFAGCGGGSSNPAPGGSSGTPAGTYTLIVKVAAGGTSGSTQLALTVQ